VAEALQHQISGENRGKASSFISSRVIAGWCPGCPRFISGSQLCRAHAASGAGLAHHFLGRGKPLPVSAGADGDEQLRGAGPAGFACR